MTTIQKSHAAPHGAEYAARVCNPHPKGCFFNDWNKHCG